MFLLPGDGDGGVWGTYALAALIASPFIVGLALRASDRRGARTGRVPTCRSWSIRTGTAALALALSLLCMVVLDAPLAALLSAIVVVPAAWPPRSTG